MAESKQTTDPGDIAEEKYRGPNEAIAALGEGAVETKFMWLIGLVTGGALAGIFHKQVNKGIIHPIQNAAYDLATKNNIFSWVGASVNWLVGKGKHANDLRKCTSGNEKVYKLAEREFHHEKGGVVHILADELTKLVDWAMRLFRLEKFETDPTVKKFILYGKNWKNPDMAKDVGEANSRLDAVMVGGGASALGGMIFGSFYGGKKGVDNVQRAKGQLARAQEEILLTRAQYERLKDEYIKAKVKLNDLETEKAAQSGTLKVAADDTPKVRDDHYDAAETEGTEKKTKPEKWTPDGGVEQPPVPENPEFPKDPKFPQEPKKPWGEKMREQTAAAETAPAELTR